MKAYIIKTDKKIEPFGDNPSDCLIGNRRLEAWQKKVLLEQGIKLFFVSDISEIKRGEECICLSDNLYFTPELLREFLVEAKKRKENSICALKKGVTTLRTGVKLQDAADFGECVGYNLRYYPRGNIEVACNRIIITSDEFEANVPIPFHMCKDAKGYAIPMTDKFAVQIDHWVNLWSCNIVFLLAELARVKKISKIKLAVLILRARSVNKWKILSKMNSIGKNCDIHPTAYIEASIIGNNVTIGAGAVVRSSVIGSNTHIGNNVTVEYSVVGEKSSILSGHLLYCVFHPGTFSVTGMVSASIVGRDSFLGVDTTLTDFRFDGKNVTVLENGERVDSGNLFLGACLGHGVYLGSGCIIAPGRVVPNGLRITFDNNRVFNAYTSKQEGFRIIDYKA